MGRFSLKQALLLSSQSKASILIEVPGNEIDYKIIAFCPDIYGNENTLEIYTVQNGKTAALTHRGLSFPKLDTLIEFVSSCNFVTDNGWTAVEEAQS